MPTPRNDLEQLRLIRALSAGGSAPMDARGLIAWRRGAAPLPRIPAVASDHREFRERQASVLARAVTNLQPAQIQSA